MARTASQPATFQTRVKRYLFRGAQMRGERARGEWRRGQINRPTRNSYYNRLLQR